MTNTCDDVRGETGVVILCADGVDFPVAWGDSGAPVFKLLPGLNVVERREIIFGMTDEYPNGGGVHRKGISKIWNKSRRTSEQP